MKSGVIFKAIPDSGMVRLGFNPAGKVDYRLPNSIILSAPVRGILLKQADVYWLGQREATSNVQFAVNTLADADEYTRGLTWIDNQAGVKIPVFNHPRAVALSRRDVSARVLRGVPGLDVPRCVRITPSSIEDFSSAAKAAGLVYPLLVRPAASQTAHGLKKISSISDWGSMREYSAFGTAYFLTEFRDFIGDDGQYTKLRIAFADGRFFIRHVKMSKNWLVNEESSSDREKMEAREIEVSKALMNHDGFKETVRGIFSRIPLDFFGVDLGFRGVDKDLVLFEANAAMSMLFDPAQSQPRSESSRRRRALFQAPLENAVIKSISAPHGWRFTGSSPSGDRSFAEILAENPEVSLQPIS